MLAETDKQDEIGTYTEWDPLEEVLLGDPLGAMKPGDMAVLDAVVPPIYTPAIESLFPNGVNRYPAELIDAAHKEVRELRAVLEGEGVRVQVAEPIDFSQPLQTPDWRVPQQFCSSNPRDSLLLIGDLIIEAPMADRSRYFETFAYRKVLKQLNQRGARWISAPKPVLSDASFTSDLKRNENASGFLQGCPTQWLTTEEEVLFDAADFMKFGKDILVSRSHVTNEAGIAWVRQILGPDFTVHVVETKNPYAMHLDDTVVPLDEGRLLYSPEYFDSAALPEIFKSWEVFEAPPVVISEKNRLGKLSGWLNINMLSIDEKRIIVERNQENTIVFLKQLGLQPVLCDFEHYFPFVGSFHCASLDIRRRGGLRSCF